jgi:hypothetical protein
MSRRGQWRVDVQTRLFLVDDDPETTQAFARMLTIEGYDVRTAGAEAGLTKWRSARRLRSSSICACRSSTASRSLTLRANERPLRTPVAIVTGDYFIEDTVSTSCPGSALKCIASRCGSRTWSASPTRSSTWSTRATASIHHKAAHYTSLTPADFRADFWIMSWLSGARASLGVAKRTES